MTPTESTRWWENYLVRYFVPIIAGMVMVNWLLGEHLQLRKFLYLVADDLKGLSSQQVVLLFLYGNLFCYIASYPVLVFHVTRAALFDEDAKANYRPSVLDSYLLTFLFGLLALLVSKMQGELAVCLAFAVVVFFSAAQVRALYIGYSKGGIYTLLCKLAHRRSGLDTIHCPNENGPPASQQDKSEKQQRVSVCVHEVTSSYRHLREHGNTALILWLELGLAGLMHALVLEQREPVAQLGLVGVLIAIWSLPAACVHLLGQHLERRFANN